MRPVISQTLLLQNMYVPPPQKFDAQTGQPVPQDEDDLQDHFEDFYEDIFEELNVGGGTWQSPMLSTFFFHLPHMDSMRPGTGTRKVAVATSYILHDGRGMMVGA